MGEGDREKDSFYLHSLHPLFASAPVGGVKDELLFLKAHLKALDRERERYREKEIGFA